MYVANIFLASQTDDIFVEPLFITEFKRLKKSSPFGKKIPNLAPPLDQISPFD